MRSLIARLFLLILLLSSSPAEACNHTTTYDDGADQDMECEVCKQKCVPKEDGSGEVCGLHCTTGNKKRHHFTCAACGASQGYGGWGACT